MAEMRTINPFAPPQASLNPPPLGEAKISAGHLVVPRQWISPPICLMTGATQDLAPPINRRVDWMSLRGFVFILLGHLLVMVTAGFNNFVVILVAVSLTLCSIALLHFQNLAGLQYYLSKDYINKRRKRGSRSAFVFLLGCLVIWLAAPTTLMLLGVALWMASGLMAPRQFPATGHMTSDSLQLVGVALPVAEKLILMQSTKEVPSSGIFPENPPEQNSPHDPAFPPVTPF